MSTTQPKVTVNIIPASQREQNEAQKILFIGQKTSAGSAPAGTLVTQIGNDNEQDNLFGKNSILATMIREAKAINNIVRYDAIPLDDDGAAVAATGTVTFGSGPATAAGTITVSVGSFVNHTYELDVASGATVTQVGDALVAAITADDTVPVTAANVAGVVTFTAVNKGLVGNTIGIKVTGSAAGITLATTAMTGGATNPSLTNVFDPVSSIRYQQIPWITTYDLTSITGFLDPRFNVDNRLLDGVGIYCETDTFANLQTAGAAEDSQSLVYIGNKTVSESLYKGSAIFELDYVIASKLAALKALRLTEDAEISQYVISTFGQRDSTGGPALASLPYFNTPFSDLPLIDIGDDFSDTEVEQLNTAGVSVFRNNLSNSLLLADTMVTTYKTDSGGNPDVSFKYLNYVDTSTNIREYFFNNLKTEYSQSRLTEGDVVPGRSMANPAIIKSFIAGLYADLAGPDFVLVQDGEAAKKFFLQNLSVTVDLSEGKATVTGIVPIVTQLREIIFNFQISFSVNA